METNNQLQTTDPKPEKSLLDDLMGDVMGIGMEDLGKELLPKIQPFLKPAQKKFKKWLIEGSHIIFVKEIKGNPTVFLLKNKKDFVYHSEGSEGGLKFSADPDAVVGVYNIDEFIEKLISGQIDWGEVL